MADPTLYLVDGYNLLRDGGFEDVCELTFATPAPAVPRMVRSEETTQTSSPARCSAASRSSSVSACLA